MGRMVIYDYPVGATKEVAINDAKRRMKYDNNFLRECGISPLPYVSFWVEARHRMYVAVDEDRKVPALRLFLPEYGPVNQGQEYKWKLAVKIKDPRRKEVVKCMKG